jgi:UDP-glucose 4-epimerase
VTGGSGYIGSHVLRALHASGHESIVLDLRPPPSEYVAGLATSVIGDVRDPEALRRLFGTWRIDAVVHIAGVKSVAESMADPARYFDINTIGTQRILEAMTLAGTSHMVFSSSAAVYGQPDAVPIGERAELRPESPYGESKALSERLLAWWDRCHAIRHVSLRYFNAAGAAPDALTGERSEGAANLIPVVLEAAIAGRPVGIFGTDYPTPDGTAIRDYIHVEDLAAAHVQALDHLWAGGSSTIVNLGTGQGASVAEVIAAATRVTKQRITVVERPRRPGDPPAVWADPGLARELLGWEASRNLDDILSTAWRWHSAQHGRSTLVEG